MKLVRLLSVCLAILSFSSRGQSLESILHHLAPRTIGSIRSSNEDYSDLEFLRETLRNNRVVLLGEQSHGEGATFEAKVRLVKFLHQELNYEILSFESGLYDNYRAFAEVADTSYRDSPLKESIFGIWSDTKEVEPLLKYVHEQKNSIKPLLVTGFDCQADNLFKEEFLSDLTKLLGSDLVLSENELAVLDEVITAGPEFIVGSESDSSLFFSTCERIRVSLERVPHSENQVRARILRQVLSGWVEMVKWEMDVINQVPVKAQNPRDLQMARNLIFLSELYPYKKIIGWGASYHFADHIERYENTAVTKSFIHAYDSVLQNEEPTNLDADLGGAIPMGRVLRDHFGQALYSIAFSSLEGEFGMLGTRPVSMSVLSPPAGSVERVLAVNNYAFVDYRLLKEELYFYSSALGNLPIRAPWPKIFDGLFFIKTSYPPSFPDRMKLPDVTAGNTIFKQPPLVGNDRVKRVVDSETKLGIPFVNIYLLNTSKGVASNASGEFTFNIPLAKRSDRIVVSSIGYATDTLSVARFLKSTKIELAPLATHLAAIEVRSKPLKAKNIIKLAEKRISENYYQNASEQEFFYRVKKYTEDSVVFNEEAAVMVYNPVGYRSSTNATKKLSGSILQFRNTTDNEDNKNPWSGVGSLWLVYTHDLILDKDNVLHRSAYYDLTLNGTVPYENRKVYEISFECKKPGAYTTGFGYPAPRSASGKIFIDVNTYAVVKIETLIQRQRYQPKKRPNLHLDPYGHQLIQTYREHNGKYFLNYSRQVHFGQWTDTKSTSSYRTLEIRELLSTDIETTSPRLITLRLKDIKSVRAKPDANFWSQHNFMMEDNIEKSYTGVGLSKK